MDILNRQRKMQEQARILREEAIKQKAQLIAANPRPPLFPAGPLPKVPSTGIRTMKTAGRKRKTKQKKTIRRSKK